MDVLLVILVCVVVAWLMLPEYGEGLRDLDDKNS